MHLLKLARQFSSAVHLCYSTVSLVTCSDDDDGDDVVNFIYLLLYVNA